MKPGLALSVSGAAVALAFAALAQPAPGARAPNAAPVDPATLQGLPAARDYRPPEGVRTRTADIVSDNVRLTAQLFYAAENEGRKLPTVVMAPGWGATAATLREDAVDLARAGYLAMLFDYRGWGESDGRVALVGARPAAGGAFTTEVRELRGYVDPWEQGEDWANAISYATTEPMADPGRIGLLGSDLAGGHVIRLAAQDGRIRALVSQVTSADLRPYKPYQPDPAKVIAEANAAAAGLAAGRTSYPPKGARTGDLVGAAVGNKAVRWAPVEDATLVGAPALFVLAQNEELFANANNGQLACERVTGPRRLMMLPGITHYGIYGAERRRAIGAAIAWFDRYLKPDAAPAQGDAKPPERGECFPPPEPPKGEEDPNGSGESKRTQDASGRWN
ncbi:alpha/beta hydrolase [Phenylobacterium sp.]|jgi:dienelactone hydrolase|uniref:alpha/beta hydrolase n=1 Tax=Phenylobacterium sp. TaxID=1871053 RepID=UPI002F9261CB